MCTVLKVYKQGAVMEVMGGAFQEDFSEGNDVLRCFTKGKECMGGES